MNCLRRSWLLALPLALALGGCAGNKARKAEAPTPTASEPDFVDPLHRSQSQRYQRQQDSGPAAPEVDIDSLSEPVPKAEPRSRYGNHSPYSVRGRSYRVLDTADGFVERGQASWYGAKFHGYMTSSMEPYDMYGFSAAHKHLPLPSYVQVTNVANGKSVVVRVNDRGPFHDGRVIDLSYAAAVRIGVWPAGVADVKVRAIGVHDANREPSPIVAVETPGARLFLQLGAFGERANAQRLVEDISRAGIRGAHLQTVRVEGRSLQRVRIGPLASQQDAEALALRVRQLGLATPRLTMDN